VLFNYDGDIYNSGSSGSLKAALSFIDKSKKIYQLPSSLRGMKLRARKNPQLNGRDIYFALLNENDNHISYEDLSSTFSKVAIKNAFLEGRTDYSDYMGVIGDDSFYRTADTLGGRGPNEEIMDLYIKNRYRSVVLTARQNLPGMNKTISDTLEEHGGGKPLAIYTRPVNSSSLAHKGRVIIDIAKQDSVSSVQFWDDNRAYIKGVDDALECYDKDNNANLTAKVKIHYVLKANKPKNSLELFLG
jgi:hypothetical protein